MSFSPMAESASPKRAKPQPKTMQATPNPKRFQGKEELLTHPERWIEAAERQLQPPPPHIRRESPTGASTRHTLPTQLASDASQRNRNRNGIQDEDANRDLIRGSPQSRTHGQAHDPTRHLLREPIPSRPRDQSPSQQPKQAATAKPASAIATPAAPTDNDIATVAPPPGNDRAGPPGMPPSADRWPFIPPPPFRSSVPPPRLPHPMPECGGEPRTLATEREKWHEQEIDSHTRLAVRKIVVEMMRGGVRRDGRGGHAASLPGARAERLDEGCGGEVADTRGVRHAEGEPRLGLQAMTQAVPVGWASQGRREEEIEVVGRRQTGAEAEGGRDGVRGGVAQWLGGRGEADERARCSGTGAGGAAFKEEQPPTAAEKAEERAAVDDQCTTPSVRRGSKTDRMSARRGLGPLRMGPAFENAVLEVEGDAKTSAEEEERRASKRGAKGAGVAKGVERMNANRDRSGLGVAVEEAADEAEWVVVSAPAPAANLQDAGAEEVEIEVEIEGDAENDAGWCVVKT